MTTHLTRRLVAAGLATVATASVARAAADLGPAVGSKAPSIGALQDQTGSQRSLADLSGAKGTVLLFYRSAGWCPYCQAQLIGLNEARAEIERRGYRLAALSYDAPDVLKGFAERRGIAFTLLSDPRSEVIRRYDLLDPQYPPGHRAHGVPRPIILVIDRQGVIRAKLFEETYQKRPPASLVVQTIDRLDR